MSVRISYRKDRKRWEVKYVGLDNRRHRPLFTDQVEAENFARRVRLGINPEERGSISIAEAGQKFYASIAEKAHKKSRANTKRYINLMYHFMTHERGVQQLVSITLSDMEAFRDWLPKQKEYDDRPMQMGASTVNRCLAVLKFFFKRQVQWGQLNQSPCLYLDFLDFEENERQKMSGEQYLAALETTEDWFKPVFHFIRLSASPASVLERLQWSDVDLVNRTYYATRRKGRKAKLKRTLMAMTDPVFALFTGLRNQWPGVEGQVFRDYSGRPLLADRISRTGNDAIRRAGIEGVTLYGLRHALASDMTAANVATEIVRQAMGHASIVTTQRYANKVPLSSIARAIESVRGGEVVANSEFEATQVRRPV